MKLQRTTLVLMVFALFLGGFVYFYEIQGKPKREAIQAKQKQIFNFQAEEIKELTIERKEQILKFERTGNDQKNWQMKQPENVPASEPTISFLLDLLVPGKSERSFNISGDRSKDYGLDVPSVTVKMLLKDGKSHQFILGKPDFQNEFIYARVEPQSPTKSEQEIILVPKNILPTLEKGPEEWKQKEENNKKSGSKPKRSQ